MKKNQHIFLSSGFTLIEAMIVVFIVAVVAVTFYSVFALGTRHIVDSKNRLGATSLANEKMEIVRNLDYEDIGTKKDDGMGGYVYGIPAGEVMEEENETRDNREYSIYTLVQYIDDSYDGTEDGSPDDLVPTDYKRVRIRVAWNVGTDREEDVVLVSTFSPSGLEQAVSGGTLSINVIDNQGLGISQASVSIYNPDLGIDVVAETDDLGNIIFPGAPAGDNYQIEVSKSGYYSVKTYAPYPTSYFQPVDEHASVVDSRLNVKSIITDKSSDLKLMARDPFGNPVPSQSFEIKGGKKIGDTLTDPSEAVFDFDASTSFDSSGDKSFTARSFGEYYFYPESGDDYYFLQLDNDQLEPDQIDLPPDTDLEVVAFYADKSVNSLLVEVVDEDDGEFIADAQVKLENSDIGFSAELVSDKYGQVFFPTSLPELDEGEYQLTVEATGYGTVNEKIDISNFIKKEIKLTAE